MFFLPFSASASGKPDAQNKHTSVWSESAQAVTHKLHVQTWFQLVVGYPDQNIATEYTHFIS